MKIKYKKGKLVIVTQLFTFIRLDKMEDMLVIADDSPQHKCDDIVNKCNQIANLIYDLASADED